MTGKIETPALRAAQQLGQPMYEGPPCRYGHTTRYTSCSNCVECAKERSKRVTAERQQRRKR